MSVIGSNILAGASGQGGGYNLDKSLRFRNSATAYMNRTPTSNGNRKTFTWSGWIKRGVLAYHYYGLFGALLPASSQFQYLRFGSDGSGLGAGEDNIEFGSYNNATNFNVYTKASFRDPSAWYHIVLAVDTTQATAANRVKIYVNNVQQTLVGTYPTQNLDTFFNSTTYGNGIGDIASNGSQTFDGYMTEINFIDGQALTPSSFGQTSSTTGVWQPKKYSGTYGTNGFYLPMNKTATVYSTTYLVIGGGGSGGGNTADGNQRTGGGGAGGYLTGTTNLISGTTYTVTVGAGGATATGDSSNSGSNSVLGSITAIGGGRGGFEANAPSVGGSGGGGATGSTTGASGTSGQGNAGADSTGYNGNGGGGGGSGSAGSGANGGSGTASSITGSSVTYAGGGAGTNGTGGSGGGGNPSTAGTANTGSGGGGGFASSGGAGGSGVVILRLLTSEYSGITSGSPTVTTDGSYTVIKYTSSGTYTA